MGSLKKKKKKRTPKKGGGSNQNRQRPAEVSGLPGKNAEKKENCPKPGKTPVPGRGQHGQRRRKPPTFQVPPNLRDRASLILKKKKRREDKNYLPHREKAPPE